MKLIAIFSIEELRKEIEKILRTVEVPVFSELDVRGFKNEIGLSGSNWFGSGTVPTFSVLNFAFVPDDQSQRLLDHISNLNDSGKLDHRIHAVVLNIEKSIF
jgi:hypothetical protein